MASKTATQPQHGLSLQNPQSANFRMSDVGDDILVAPVNVVAQDGIPSQAYLYALRGANEPSLNGYMQALLATLTPVGFDCH